MQIFVPFWFLVQPGFCGIVCIGKAKVTKVSYLSGFLILGRHLSGPPSLLIVAHLIVDSTCRRLLLGLTLYMHKTSLSTYCQAVLFCCLNKKKVSVCYALIFLIIKIFNKQSLSLSLHASTDVNRKQSNYSPVKAKVAQDATIFQIYDI